MTEHSDLPSLPLPDASGFFGQLAEGGLLRLMVSKPIQQAIGRLVFGAAEVVASHMDRHSQGVRADTAARTAVTKAIAAQTVAHIKKDKSVAERGLERWAVGEQRKQEAREDVARRTLHILADSPDSEQLAQPSEDFMLAFEDAVDRTSSEDLRDLMARILSGEIRHPGSVSRAALRVAQILDKEIIDSMAFIKPYIIGRRWVDVHALGTEHFHVHAYNLFSIALCSEIGARQHGFNEFGRALYEYENGCIALQCDNRHMKFKPLTDAFNLTKVGVELMHILPATNPLDLRDAAKNLLKLEHIESVWVGRCERQEGLIHFFPNEAT